MTIMPHVKLLIAQGGMATTMEALYHGLPQLLLTCGYPQLEMYADNISKHGLGIHLRESEMSVDNIQTSITRLFEDPTVQEHVNRMQRLIKKSPGAEAVVNFLEDVLQSS
jgi:UDP:flavonoid glycosyltransferase YjiC (YdhE family)